MNSENRFYVYTYSYPNGTPFYVGKGTNKRINHHLLDAKAGRKLNSYNVRVVRKLLSEGKEPIVNKIIDNIDEELAFLVEQEFIAKYGRRNDGSGILTNNTNGGEGTFGAKGIKRTPEQIAAMKKRLTGLKQSDESKAKKSLAMKGYIYKKVTCPNCSLTGGETSMKRWHFDKCTGIKNFRARAYVNGKRHHVGYYVSLEEAEIAKQKFIEQNKA
jgi:hypothetical protein